MATAKNNTPTNDKPTNNNDKPAKDLVSLADLDAKCKGTIMMDVHDLTFSAKANYSRNEKELNLPAMIQQLIQDKKILQPLVAARLTKSMDKLTVACGNRRGLSTEQIEIQYPEIYSEFFAGKIPVTIYEGLNDNEFTALANDNLATQQIGEFGAFKTFQRLERLGLQGTEITNRMAPYYYKMAGSDKRLEYDKQKKLLAEKGVLNEGKSNEIRNEYTLNKWYWRRQYQDDQRLSLAFKLVPTLEEVWEKGLLGEEGGIKITGGMREKIIKAGTDKFDDKDGTERLAALIVKHGISPQSPMEAKIKEARVGAINDIVFDGGDREDPPKKLPKRSQLETMRDVAKADAFIAQLDLILDGGEEAEEALLEMEERLIIFDAAFAKDSEATMKALHAIIAGETLMMK